MKKATSNTKLVELSPHQNRIKTLENKDSIDEEGDLTIKKKQDEQQTSNIHEEQPTHSTKKEKDHRSLKEA